MKATKATLPSFALSVALAIVSASGFAQAPQPNQTIITLAGGDAQNVPATGVGFAAPRAVAVNGSGNFYFSDCSRIYKVVLVTGNLTTVAGSSSECGPGNVGDGGPALGASLDSPDGLVVDADGNVYFADAGNDEIREVSASDGKVSAIAGTGTAGYSGDGGAAAQAELSAPRGLVMDGSGNLYFIDSSQYIREISKDSGNISTIATVTGGISLAMDSNGGLYVGSAAGTLSHIAVSGGTVTVTVIAGGGAVVPAAGGTATQASFGAVRAVTVDGSGNIIFAADTQASAQPNDQIWEIAAGGATLQWLGGGGTAFSPTGPATASALGLISALAADTSGGLLLGTGNYVLSLDAGGNLSAVAGNGNACGETPSTNMPVLGSMVTPTGVGGYGNDFADFADACANVVWTTIHGSSSVTAYAGTGTPGYSGDGGPAGLAQLSLPEDVVTDESGNDYIADTGNNVIREVVGNDITIITYAGTAGVTSGGDGGPATSAGLNGPTGVTVDAAGNLYIADRGNGLIRRVDATTQVITTVAGGGSDGPGDGGPATSAVLNHPEAVAVDTNGNLFIADQGNEVDQNGNPIADSTIRRVDATTGIITTVAGVGDPGGNPPSVAVGSGDGGPATAAGLTQVMGLDVDANDNLYIADTGAAKVREVDNANGNIYTVGGTGAGGVSGDNGPALQAELTPCGIRFDDAYDGDLDIADCHAGRVREIENAIGEPVLSVNGASASADPGDFGSQLVGQATTQTLTLTNPGVIPLALSGITEQLGGNNDFTETNNCPTSLAGGQSCTITLTFTPSSLGTYEYANYIIGNSVSPYDLYADGEGGTPPAASLGLSSLSFASQTVGSTSPGQTVVLSNTGGNNYNAAALTGIAVQTTGPFSASNNCGGTVGDGENCSIVVTFTPTASGAASGTLSISDDASGSPQTVALSGTGVAASATAVLYPAALEFTNQPQGMKSAAQAVLVTNTGAAALAISSIDASGDFTQSNNCGPSLAPEAVCSISVAFTPSASGNRTGTLTLTDGAGDAPATVALSGAGAVTPPIITTVAGGGPVNLPAAQAGIPAPSALAYDAAGDLYIESASTRQVLKLTPDGLMTVFAGNGTLAASGDGGPAAAAGVGQVEGLAVDAKGDVFISDEENDVVREVTPDGTISTYAGTAGQHGYAGDGGPANQAELYAPYGLVVDSAGNLYIADYDNNRVREVNAATGVITTFAGDGSLNNSGQPPYGGLATSVALSFPQYLATDQAGDIYIGSNYGGSSGEVPAGTGTFNPIYASQMAVDAAGNIYDAYNSDFPGGANVGEVIENYNQSNYQIGGGSIPLPAALGGPASAVLLNDIEAITVSPAGLVTFASGGYILQDDANGNLQALAGDGIYYNSADGLPALASSTNAGALAHDAAGDVYFATAVEVRELVAATGDLVTVAGNGTFPTSGPGGGDGGPATTAQVSPRGIALDAAGNLYIADPAAVREVNAVTGVITTIAGTGVSGYSGDGGPATQAQLGSLEGLAVDSQGDVFVADAGHLVYSDETYSYTLAPRVWELMAGSGTIKTVAGGGTNGLGDGGPATSAQLWTPEGIALDGAGNLYIADAGVSDLNLTAASRVREVNLATGAISTFAGGGAGPGNGDGGPAAQATLSYATGVAVDAYGNVYVADNEGFAIRRVDAASGVISTVAGNGSYGVSGDGGPATQAEIGGPNGLVFDPAGNLYFSTEGTIRKVEDLAPPPALAPASLAFGSQLVGQASAPQTLTLSNPGVDALAVTSIAITGQASAGFAETNTCGSSLAAGTTCTIAVTFTPSAAGAATGTVTVTPAVGAAIAAALTGTGATPGPAVTLAPTALSFASQLTGSASTAQTVTLTNGGTAALSIASIAVAGADAGDYSETNTCGTAVAAGANCTIAVTFKPTATGTRTGTLTITDNAGDSPESVALSGAGADLTIAPSPGSSTTATVAAGKPATYGLQFTPVAGASGTYTLSCTGAPTGATCTPSVASIDLSGTTPVPVTVTVTTTVRTSGAPPLSGPEPWGPWQPWQIFLLLAGLGLLTLALGIVWRGPRRAARWLAPLAASALFAVCIGCGGGASSGGSGSNNSPASTGTPAGTYQLTITATGPGGATRSTSLSLTVQ